LDKKLEASWKFEVFGPTSADNFSDAKSSYDYHLKMVPDYCRLEYNPIKLSPQTRKCQVQYELMQSVTTRIWQEKLTYGLSEIIHHHTERLYWLIDPEDLNKVLKDADDKRIQTNEGACYQKDNDNAILRDSLNNP